MKVLSVDNMVLSAIAWPADNMVLTADTNVLSVDNTVLSVDTKV
jgi:hypothetical protein